MIIFQRDHDGKVTSEEVAAAATYLKHNLDNTGIEELIGGLSKDKGNYLTVASAPRRDSEYVDKY
jgi:Ca2+-binding EF-hand superfamily protein